MNQQQYSTGDYVQLMINCQSRLYAFILSLVGDAEHASEVLQETNLVLWEKSNQFEPDTNFVAWAFRIARYQVMAHRQRLGRDRHLFDDETLACVAQAGEDQAVDFDERLTTLSECIEQLPEGGRRLLRRRYMEGLSVKLIAEELGHTANRVSVRLHRIRTTLMECIQKHQAEGDAV
jgi:RNA polymerase sigma-70 factor (ECF subfamily)